MNKLDEIEAKAKGATPGRRMFSGEGKPGLAHKIWVGGTEICEQWRAGSNPKDFEFMAVMDPETTLQMVAVVRAAMDTNSMILRWCEYDQRFALWQDRLADALKPFTEESGE